MCPARRLLASHVQTRSSQVSRPVLSEPVLGPDLTTVDAFRTRLESVAAVDFREMAREGIEPPTRGFSGSQRPIPPGLPRSISDRPASTYYNT